jgi:hypothetical protein
MRTGLWRRGGGAGGGIPRDVPCGEVGDGAGAGVVAPLLPNRSCDIVLWFCGIRLHQIRSLRCPAAFAVGAAAKNATPTDASYAGCSRWVQSLQKVSSFFAFACFSSHNRAVAWTDTGQ